MPNGQGPEQSLQPEIRDDGFYGVIERTVKNQTSMGHEPDLVSLFTFGKFLTLPPDEREALMQYAIAQEYLTPEQYKQITNPEPESEAPADVPLATPVPGASAPREQAPRAEQTERQPYKIVELPERLARLQQRGYVMTRANIAERVEKGHGRIFIGYGAEQDPNEMDGRFYLREAYAKKLGKEIAQRRGEDFETQAPKTDIVLPENIRDRWNSDATFRGEVLRRCVDMRDEMEENVHPEFDGLPRSMSEEEAAAFHADPNRLKPKWKYRLDGKWNYRPFDGARMSAKAIDAILNNPRGFRRDQEFKSWLGRPLQHFREDIISERLAEEYGPQVEAAVPETEPAVVAAPPKSEPTSEAATETRAPEPTRATPAPERERPTEVSAEIPEWPLDQIFDHGNATMKVVAPLFEKTPDMRQLVNIATSVTEGSLEKTGKHPKSRHRMPHHAVVLSGLSGSFTEYFKDDAAARKEALGLLLHDALVSIADETFGPTNDEAEAELREQIVGYVASVAAGRSDSAAAEKLGQLVKFDSKHENAFDIQEDNIEHLKRYLRNLREALD